MNTFLLHLILTQINLCKILFFVWDLLIICCCYYCQSFQSCYVFILSYIIFIFDLGLYYISLLVIKYLWSVVMYAYKKDMTKVKFNSLKPYSYSEKYLWSSLGQLCAISVCLILVIFNLFTVIIFYTVIIYLSYDYINFSCPQFIVKRLLLLCVCHFWIGLVKIHTGNCWSISSGMFYCRPTVLLSIFACWYQPRPLLVMSVRGSQWWVNCNDFVVFYSKNYCNSKGTPNDMIILWENVYPSRVMIY